MQRANRFRRKLFLTGLLLLILMMGAFGQAYRSAMRAVEMNALVAHTHEVLHETEALRLNRVRLRNTYYSYRQTRDPGFIEAFDARRHALDESIERLRSLTADRASQQALLDRLTPALSRDEDTFEEAMTRLGHSPADSPQRASSVSIAIPAGDETCKLIDQFENTENSLFQARSTAVAENAKLTLGTVLLSGFLSVLILAVSVFLIQREIMKRAQIESGLRSAQEILGVRFEEQRSELDHLVEDLHAQIRGRNAAETDLKQLNEELENRVAARTSELQELNRELEAFTYSVSHDLKAPLRHMDGFSKILQQEFGPSLPAEAKHYLERVRAAATHMSTLVEDLLELSRLGRQSPRLQSTSLRALAEEARQEVLSSTPGRKIDWMIDSLPVADVDPALLRQVFINLLSNAVKFTRKNPNAAIEVKAQRENGLVHISVRDNGAGFDPRYADKLFGVFQRLHRQDEYEGTGIGLATVQRIVFKHGGRVWADSQPDQGATFHFTLPASGDPAPALREPVGARA